MGHLPSSHSSLFDLRRVAVRLLFGCIMSRHAQRELVAAYEHPASAAGSGSGSGGGEGQDLAVDLRVVISASAMRRERILAAVARERAAGAEPATAATAALGAAAIAAAPASPAVVRVESETERRLRALSRDEHDSLNGVRWHVGDGDEHRSLTRQQLSLIAERKVVGCAQRGHLLLIVPLTHLHLPCCSGCRRSGALC